MLLHEGVYDRLALYTGMRAKLWQNFAGWWCAHVPGKLCVFSNRGYIDLLHELVGRIGDVRTASHGK